MLNEVAAEMFELLSNRAESGCCSLFVTTSVFFQLSHLRRLTLLYCRYHFSFLFGFFCLLTSSFASLLTYTASLSLEGPPGPTIDGDDGNDAWRGEDRTCRR